MAKQKFVCDVKKMLEPVITLRSQAIESTTKDAQNQKKNPSKNKLEKNKIQASFCEKFRASR